MAQRFHKPDVEKMIKDYCRRMKKIPSVSDIEAEHSRDPNFPSYATVFYYFGGIPPLKYFFETEVKGQGVLFPA